MTPRRPARRRTAAVAALPAAAASVLALAGPASAHVGIEPDEAERGGHAVVDFTVPNERDDASTVALEVVLPADRPLASVRPQAVPGWDVEVTRTKLDEPLEVHGGKPAEAPARITWTAEKGGGIEPGAFQQFPVSLGPLPEDADRLVFKALQRYDDGEVVRWIEEPPKDGGEPENPAPVLHLAAAGGRGGAEPAARSAEGGGHADAGGAPGDTTARVLAAAGIAAGIAGIALGTLAGRRRTP